MEKGGAHDNVMGVSRDGMGEQRGGGLYTGQICTEELTVFADVRVCGSGHVHQMMGHGSYGGTERFTELEFHMSGRRQPRQSCGGLHRRKWTKAG